MNDAGDRFKNKAAELRRAFDRSFAGARHADTALFDDFLAIRLRDDPHVLRLDGVARLLPLRALTRFPSPLAQWLGLAGVAGTVIPVYDLGLLLGYPAGATPRWMAVCSAAPVALAFDVFEGQFRHPREAGSGTQPSPRGEVLRTPGQVRPVVPTDEVLATIKSLALQGVVQKER
jgi:purine-binding chemotaxis protein CheW